MAGNSQKIEIAPVLLTIFNRPSTTSRVFDALRKARPEKLYVAADGPRFPEENHACVQARRITEAVDWPCQVKRLYRDTNSGCGRAMSSSISWLFEHEDRGIILEDDCVPSDWFLPRISEMLTRFADASEIGTVSGVSYLPLGLQGPAPYYLSRHPLVWGWGTWRRTWADYDFNMSDWPLHRDLKWLRSVSDGHLDSALYWRDHFDRVFAGRIDTWDAQLVFSLWLHRRKSLNFTRNAIQNIGFAPDATHTKSESPILSHLRHSPEGDSLWSDDPQMEPWLDRWIDTRVYRVRRSLPKEVLRIFGFARGRKDRG